MGTAWKKIAGAGEIELPVLQSSLINKPVSQSSATTDD